MESSSTMAYPPHSVEQELHALFHPQDWLNPAIHVDNPADMLPNSAFGFARAFNCASFGIPQHALTDDSRSWIDKNLSHVLSHGLPKDSNSLLLSNDPNSLLPHGQIPKESCVEQMMSTLIRNGGVNEVFCANSNTNMAQTQHKLSSFTHNVGLTDDPSKGGLSISQDVHVLAPSMDFEFARKAANLSYLSKLASFPSSISELAQVAANPLQGNRGKVDSNSSKLSKVGSQESFTRMTSGLHTFNQPVCKGPNIPNKCRVGFQGTVKQTVTMSPNAHTILQIKGEPLSIDKSDESFGQEESSLCETNGGCETTTERVNKGKNKRVKGRSKDDAAGVSNVKDTETSEVKRGKRYKSGGDTSEEDQKVESGDSTPSKESSKPPEPPKPDYIHVRARRGQATDSHSLAERVRREKISERMKFLQDLVPGCSKITGKALMLDEIINYVQSLQRQVEFLSMKLTSINPLLDLNIDGLFGKEVIQPQAIQHQALMMGEESPTSYAPYIHLSQHAQAPHQMVVDVHSLEGLDMAARHTMSTALAPIDSYGDSASQLTQAWDEELQQVLQGRVAPPTSSSLKGPTFFNGKVKFEL